MMAGHYNPKDKEKAQEWARNLLRQPNFYVLDTETTGTGPRDEIVQVGIIDKNNRIIVNCEITPVIMSKLEILKKRGRKINVFYESNLIKVFEIVNTSGQSKTDDLIF